MDFATGSVALINKPVSVSEIYEFHQKPCLPISGSFHVPCEAMRLTRVRGPWIGTLPRYA